MNNIFHTITAPDLSVKFLLQDYLLNEPALQSKSEEASHWTILTIWSLNAENLINKKSNFIRISGKKVGSARAIQAYCEEAQHKTLPTLEWYLGFLVGDSSLNRLFINIVYYCK